MTDSSPTEQCLEDIVDRNQECLRRLMIILVEHIPGIGRDLIDLEQEMEEY